MDRSPDDAGSPLIRAAREPCHLLSSGDGQGEPHKCACAGLVPDHGIRGLQGPGIRQQLGKLPGGIGRDMHYDEDRTGKIGRQVAGNRFQAPDRSCGTTDHNDVSGPQALASFLAGRVRR